MKILARPGVYALVNTKTSKVYIGSTHNLAWRWSKHKSDFKLDRQNNRSLKEDYKIHGLDSFEFVVLEVVEDVDVREIEQMYMDFCSDSLYNVSSSAWKRIAKMPKDAVDKMGIRKLNNKYWVGRPHKESSKDQIGQTKRPQGYCFISPEGEFVRIANLTGFCAQRQLSRTSMQRVDNGRLDQYKGWRKAHT